MKTIILFVVFGWLIASADSSKEDCILLKGSIQYHDVENSHEVRVADRTIIIGGPEETHSPNMDHLAVQRGLINCAPKILECIRKEKVNLPADFNVSFDLNSSSEESAQASNFKFVWSKGATERLNNCLMTVWSKNRYGLMIKETKKISMPVKIK